MAKAVSKGKDAGKVVAETQILQISEGLVKFAIIGTSPLIFNRMHGASKKKLLMGSAPKNAAEKAANVKHNPPDEYRASVYRNVGDNCATRLKFPAPALKGAIKTAALDMPGATKSGMGRRIWIPGDSVDIFGVPRLLIATVRSADIARTPDMRTRAIVKEWCTEVTIAFARPLLTEKQIAALFAAGGILCGIGDWRQEKGSGSYGQFRLCSKNDEDYKRIVKEGGRAAQDAALEKFDYYDAETEELVEHYYAEMERLGRDKSPVANDDEEVQPEAA